MESVEYHFFTYKSYKMNSKTAHIIYWVFTALLGALFLFSAYGKLMPTEEGLKMSESMGLNASSVMTLGVVELLSILLFIYPRTGVLGTLLLTAYLGGAIATHLEHATPVMTPCIILAVLWILAILRFPELRSRIMG